MEVQTCDTDSGYTDGETVNTTSEFTEVNGTSDTMSKPSDKHSLESDQALSEAESVPLIGGEGLEEAGQEEVGGGRGLEEDGRRGEKEEGDTEKLGGGDQSTTKIHENLENRDNGLNDDQKLDLNANEVLTDNHVM